jgi:hypothetical protein
VIFAHWLRRQPKHDSGAFQWKIVCPHCRAKYKIGVNSDLLSYEDIIFVDLTMDGGLRDAFPSGGALAVSIRITEQSRQPCLVTRTGWRSLTRERKVLLREKVTGIREELERSRKGIPPRPIVVDRFAEYLEAVAFGASVKKEIGLNLMLVIADEI